MVAYLFALLVIASPLPKDEALIIRAMDCGADPFFAQWMLEQETLAGIPEALRGSTLARACQESRFNPKARGDCAPPSGTWAGRSKDRRCKAHGIFQFWPWAESKRFNDRAIERDDPHASVRLWLQRVVMQLIPFVYYPGGRAYPAKVKLYCRRQYKDPIKRWLVAMARVNRSPKDRYGYHRCNERPTAHKLLKRWARGL